MVIDEAAVSRLRAALIRESGGGKLTAQQVTAARIALTQLAQERNPAGGRAAAVTEAAAVLGRVVTRKGKVRLSESVKASRRRRADEAAARQAVTEVLARRSPVRESAPAQAPARDLAKLDKEDLAGELLAAWGTARQSSFYRPPGMGAAQPAVMSPEDLAGLDMDALRSHSASVLQAAADAGGFGSPIWQDGGLRSTARN